MGKTSDIILVGIGASAGGLEALKELIDKVNISKKFCYVIAQHLSPSHKSMLVSLLSRNSRVKVKELVDGDTIKPDIIYITPPNYNVICEKNVLKLIEPHSFVGPKPSIDLFFKTMAECHAERCCGIILSGTGSDGSIGVRAVKASGGITMAQSPESSKYDGMPRAAIDTGDVDIILKPDVIYSELEEIYIKKRPLHISDDDHSISDSYSKIIENINRVYKVNLEDYKENTIDRRIRRRMSALKLNSHEEYLSYMDKNPDEIGRLFKDMLISVTSFFRDRQAFDKLKDALAARLIGEKKYTCRVWIVACATGEEAYSVAMLLAEIYGDKLQDVDIQIFATDIDDSALAIARKGVYSEAAVSDMDSSLLEKYFRRSGSHFEVVKSIREMVIFSRHDIIKDPPFLRIDLITCRNLLIYFKTKLQKEVLSKFYYSLNAKGLLLLGKSETVGEFSSMMHAVSNKLRIYEVSNSDASIRRLHVNDYNSLARKKSDLKTVDNRFSIDKYLSELNFFDLFDKFLIVDDNFSLYYIHGKINDYAEFAHGTFKSNVMNILKKTVRSELRGLIQKARTSNEIIYGNFKEIEDVTRDIYYRLQIKKIQQEAKETGFYIVIIEEIDRASLPHKHLLASDKKDDAYAQLEMDLNSTREHLQTVIEELETSNEELQSLNEELQSSNEELQSSNEELETTNEELQATNEELNTAYSELKQLYEDKEKSQIMLAEKSEALEKYKNELVVLNTSLEQKVAGEVAKRVEKELYISEIFNTANVGICITNSKGIFTEFNKAYLDIYGYTREELLGKSFTIVVQDEHKSMVSKMHQDFIMGVVDEIPSEWEVVRKDGQKVNVVTTANRIKLNGETSKITSVTDITELKKLENDKVVQEHLLIQQSKFAAMGEMVAAIAHQWKQPINSLSLIFQNFLIRMDENIIDIEDVKESSNIGMELISFMNETINSFKDFYSLNNKVNDINAVEQVVNTVKILNAKIQTFNVKVILKSKVNDGKFEQVEFEDRDMKYGKYFTHFSISGFSNDFQQIVLSLLSNAIDAMQEKNASGNSHSPSKLTINLTSKDGKVILDVYDNGKGVPDKIKDKIFDPYFTTKEKEAGTGIGLYIVKQIVTSRFRGTVSCANTKHGAKFTVVLPRFG